MSRHRKDVQALLRRASRAGATVRRTGGDHWQVRGPRGTVVMAATPRSGRSLLNSRADLRRIGLDV